MNLIPPIGLIFKAIRFLYSYFLKFLFQKTYELSHSYWRKRHQLGSHWQQCNSMFEYTLYLGHNTDPEPQENIIAFRALGKKIEKLCLVFEASSSYARYQEVITLYEVDVTPIVWKMAQIPIEELLFADEKHGIQFTWNQFHIYVKQLKFEDGIEASPWKTLRSSLTHTGFLNSEWNKLWGAHWNLDAIKFAREELRIYWRHGFGHPRNVVYLPHKEWLKVKPKFISPWRIKVILTRPIAWAMSTDILLRIQFWIAIWSGLYLLNDKVGLQWRWTKK